MSIGHFAKKRPLKRHVAMYINFWVFDFGRKNTGILMENGPYVHIHLPTLRLFDPQSFHGYWYFLGKYRVKTVLYPTNVANIWGPPHKCWGSVENHGKYRAFSKTAVNIELMHGWREGPRKPQNETLPKPPWKPTPGDRLGTFFALSCGGVHGMADPRKNWAFWSTRTIHPYIQTT